MDKNWTVIFSSGNLQKAELVKSLLAHNEIQSVIINHQDFLNKFGDIQVYVNRDDVVKAKFVLKENDASS
jgi:hypothetical protein